MDSANLYAQPTVTTILPPNPVYAGKVTSHDQANVFLKKPVLKIVTPRTVFATAMMDSFSSETSFNAENVEKTKFTTVKTVYATLDSPETRLDNASEETSSHLVD